MRSPLIALLLLSAAVAGRLKWHQESATPYSSSYRLYARDTCRFLGARPHSLAAYGDDRGQLARISIVFANKGDSGGRNFELRWIHRDEADAVTHGNGFVINL